MVSEISQLRYSIQGVASACLQLKDLVAEKESKVSVPDNISLHKANLKLEKQQYENMNQVARWCDKISSTVEILVDKVNDMAKEFMSGFNTESSGFKE